jgi:hypothetical protein
MPRALRIVLALAVLLACRGSAFADEGAREAGKHFQRAVALYGEADYRAALVEFKRAYAISPNAAVLYNVGEAEFQLQDYAAALGTFEKYLAEASPSESHRAEVEGNVEVLRARVGHVTVTTSPAGADVTIDDQPVGRTPIERPVLVSVGHRKVMASMPGRSPVVRYVDVATDDNLPVALQLPAADAQSVAPTSAMASLSPTATEPARSSRPGATLRTIGWITTGALAVGAGTFGVMAIMKESDLKYARTTYPTSQAALSQDASLVGRYSVLADSLGAAALVIGGITLATTLSASSSSKTGSRGGAELVRGLGSARIQGTF